MIYKLALISMLHDTALLAQKFYLRHLILFCFILTYFDSSCLTFFKTRSACMMITGCEKHGHDHNGDEDVKGIAKIMVVSVLSRGRNKE